jgi:hypothetical protein
VLDGADELSLLATSMSLSHFSELETELEQLGSVRHVGLTEDQVGALWIQLQSALD